MKIKITREDIRNAKEARSKFETHETLFYSRSETCPLAFALSRLYNKGIKLVHIRVMPWCIYIDDRRVNLTKEIREIIEEIDRKKDRIRPRELEIIDA